MKVVEKKEKYIESIDGERVMQGDVCVFWAKGLLCIGIFKCFGNRGAVEFAGLFDNGKFAIMPSAITNLIIWHDVMELIMKGDK